MSNHLSDLLAKWYPERDKCDWVLATIYHTEGPCYRKAGAMMLFSSQGEQLGMLSGGCLESDIALNARKVMHSGKPLSLCYDGTDEDDVSFHLGIGCGGRVFMMLQQINNQNNYLALIDVHQALKQRITGYYYQGIVVQQQDPYQVSSTTEHAYFLAQNIKDFNEVASTVDVQNNTEQKSMAALLAIPIIPTVHLLIIGGGVDAQPVVNIAKQLAWQVSLWDPRAANARQQYFPNADHIINGNAESLSAFCLEKKVNATIVMSHNIAIDAQALQAMVKTNINYLALLGPSNRRQQVIAHAQLNNTVFPFTFKGPAGLNIGGNLPESIALSILSECHACLYGKNAQSLMAKL